MAPNWNNMPSSFSSYIITEAPIWIAISLSGVDRHNPPIRSSPKPMEEYSSSLSGYCKPTNHSSPDVESRNLTDAPPNHTTHSPQQHHRFSRTFTICSFSCFKCHSTVFLKCLLFIGKINSDEWTERATRSAVAWANYTGLESATCPQRLQCKVTSCPGADDSLLPLLLTLLGCLSRGPPELKTHTYHRSHLKLDVRLPHWPAQDRHEILCFAKITAMWPQSPQRNTALRKEKKYSMHFGRSLCIYLSASWKSIKTPLFNKLCKTHWNIHLYMLYFYTVCW